MDISFSSMFFHDATLEDVFRATGASGADTLEFWLETPDFWLKGLQISDLKRWMIQYPTRAPLSIHAPVLDLNPCSINPDVREVSIRWILRSIELADRMGASVCTIHPGRRTAKRPPSITDYQRLGHMLDCIESVADEVRVKIAIENMEPAVNALLTTPEEVIKILDERSWLCFTFDFAHAAKSGPDIISSFLACGRERMVNIHLSGAGTRHMHGSIRYDQNVESFLTSLRDWGYNGQITLEINDLVLPQELSYSQKISFMNQEIAWLKKII
ncbi:MAG TPA: sugar phosphate isomerase/epimerase family protein [Methanospirillum sp.]|uniref:sugar phosphate isomerase/epimerase family protein n=3 Tax=Methanospirillum sp. TaxID=45200 RepID=UPI002C34CC3E|nr:sugar phosphate isomerase/epimerase family protein [Methanospirillum sp.]HOJ97594.1 sugar phosphate isomerase/epimerase family protein [Methanospirillum sp.]